MTELGIASMLANARFNTGPLPAGRPARGSAFGGAGLGGDRARVLASLAELHGAGPDGELQTAQRLAHILPPTPATPQRSPPAQPGRPAVGGAPALYGTRPP